MADLTKIFGAPFSVTTERHARPVEEQIRDAMIAHDITPPDTIRMSGKIERFCSSGKKGKSGWYVFFTDGIPSGKFGCWRSCVEVPFKADIGRDLTASETMIYARRMEEARAAREKEQEESQEVAALIAEHSWAASVPADPEHPYLKRKGIQPNGARVTGDGRLIVPLYGEDGAMTSVQFIDPHGQKSYQKAGKVAGSFCILGEIEKNKTIYIGEGFATCATVHEVSGNACVVAYSASNLIKVAGIMRRQYGPMQSIVIVADNDESDTGRNSAEQASAKHGVSFVIPPVKGDANDYHLAGNDLMALLDPPKDTSWLIKADDFCLEPAPIKWLLKSWIPEESLVMVHGPSGGGKSFFVIDACAHIASSKKEWLGHKTKDGCVVYLAGEGHHGMRGRLAAWKNHHRERTLNMYISKEGLDLNTPEGYRRTFDALSQLPEPPKCIVVDTLNRFLLGDENSAEDTKSMLDACNLLMRTFKCTVILVHHTGVAEGAQHRARGSSAWRGALDIEISIIASVDGSPIEIIQRKNKDSELAENMYIRLEQVIIPGWFDEDGEQVTSAVVMREDQPEKGTNLDAKTREACNFMRNAFAACGGGELINGQPYISRSALIEYIMDEMSLTESGANRRVAPGGGHECSVLLRYGILARHAQGYMVEEGELKSQILGSMSASAMLAPKTAPKIRLGESSDD